MENLQFKELLTVAEVSLSYRPVINAGQRPIIKCSAEAYEILIEVWNMDKISLCEQFWMIMLNNRGRVLGVVELSSGGYTGTVADVRMIYGVALKACACSIIVAHNHPSGDLTPSSQDIKMTNQLVAAGKLLDLPLNDHLIVKADGFRSLADDGYI